MFDCYYSSDLKQMHEMLKKKKKNTRFTESYYPLRQAQQTKGPKKVILFGTFCSFFSLF